MNQNDTCPFAAGMCLFSDTAALSMDTGNISSHDDLGINTQEKDRITYRRKTTCAPLQDQGYVTSLNYTDAVKRKNLGKFGGQRGDILDFYNFGRSIGNNFTYYYNRHAATTGFGYELDSSLYDSGGLENTWTPVHTLSRDDADVSIMFLAANRLLYSNAVYDPIFAATTEKTSFIDNGRNITYFSSDFFVSPLACIDQHQFCNPNNQKCTDLQSYYTAVKRTASIEFNAVQSMITSRLSIDFIWETISLSKVASVPHPIKKFRPLTRLGKGIGGRGAAALRAQESVSGIVSAQLPNNQWMIEVESWFATGLAKLQQLVVQYAAGPPNVVEGAYISKPTDPISQMMCNNQQVRSTSNAINFSTLGIVIILVIGGLLIITSLVLDTLVGFIQRKWNMRDYQRVQWALDEKLQLQRLAYEEAGMGTWSGGTSFVPVTKFGETFGMPPDVDPDHPRIVWHKESSSNVSPSSTYKNGSGEELQPLSTLRYTAV
ncbi:MAG: hypothetical protein M1830_005684 [Pleopsidium flavum]|nr:MAG: hypothetical protein M1830_005684 [Pleopsidium flavum]